MFFFIFWLLLMLFVVLSTTIVALKQPRAQAFDPSQAAADQGLMAEPVMPDAAMAEPAMAAPSSGGGINLAKDGDVFEAAPVDDDQFGGFADFN